MQASTIIKKLNTKSNSKAYESHTVCNYCYINNKKSIINTKKT